jgi:3-methyladenine DNA glycosylase/8-oxoguanine DNA glycosylase
MLLGELKVRTPFPWQVLLDYYSHRLTPGFESVEGGCYRRIEGKRTITVEYQAKPSRLIVTSNARVGAEETLAAAARLFDIDHDHEVVREPLHRSKPLRQRLLNLPGMRPLGAWSPFELCLRTILGQQVTVAAAGTLMRRLVERCGSVTPECVVAANLDNMGMPGKRVAALRSFAQAMVDGRVDFARPWMQVEAALQTLPGFGPWTRAYLAIRLGRDRDAFPASDIGLIRAANVESPAQLLKLAEAWRPLRAYAAIYLWAVSE